MGEWKKVKLGDLLEEYCERNVDKKYKVVAVGKYGIRKREDIYSKELSKDISKNKVIMKDTLTIGMGNNQIDIGILTDDSKFCVSPAYTTYKIKNCNSKFLEYYLEYLNPKLSDLFMIIGARQGKSVDKEGLLKYELMLPTIEEQEIIYRIVNKIDQICRKVDIKYKYFEDLKNKVNTDIFKVAKKFKKIKISKYLDIITDYHSNGAYKKLKENVTLLKEPNYAIMIRTTNLSQNDFNEDLLYISKEAYNFLSKSKVKENDILMNKIANPGTMYLMPKLNKPVSCGMNLFLIRFNKEVNQRYMFYNMKNVEKEIKKLAHGSTTKTITKDEVKNFEIYIHDKNRQDEIVKILTKFDYIMKNLEKQKKYYEKLKKGVMQKLLTGKVRVKK